MRVGRRGEAARGGKRSALGTRAEKRRGRGRRLLAGGATGGAVGELGGGETLARLLSCACRSRLLSSVGNPLFFS